MQPYSNKKKMFKYLTLFAFVNGPLVDLVRTKSCEWTIYRAFSHISWGIPQDNACDEEFLPTNTDFWNSSAGEGAERYRSIDRF